MLVVADLHLKNHDRTWVLHPGLQGDSDFAIDQILEIAVRMGVDTLVLAGDVFDAKEQRGTPLSQANKLVDGMRERKIGVWYVTGQHEQMPPHEPQILSAINDHAKHISGELFRYNGRMFYGLDYRPASLVKRALEEVPNETDILITHQVWQEFMGETRGSATARWMTAAPTIITGDYHDCVYTTWHNANDKQLSVFSPGPVTLQRVSERDDKYVMHMGSNGDMSPIQLTTRPVRRKLVDLSANSVLQLEKSGELDTWFAPDNSLPTPVQKPIVVLTHVGTGVPDSQLVQKCAKDRAFVFVRVGKPEKPEERVIVSGISLQDVDGLLHDVVKQIAATPEVAEDVLAVLDSQTGGNLRDTLQSVFDRRKELVNGIVAINTA